MEPLPEFLSLLSRRGREPDSGPVALAGFRVAMLPASPGRSAWEAVT
jgi:hypothetical protein